MAFYCGVTLVLTDEELIQKFEDKTLEPKEFDHLGHLRIAGLYLSDYELAEAVWKVTHGISTYAISLGATDKYQRTLTEAIVYIMDNRMTLDGDLDFPNFIHSNKDLMDDLHGVLAQFYSAALLNSKEAKVKFIAPDIKSFNHPIDRASAS